MKYFVFSIKIIIILAFVGILNTRYQIPNTAYAEALSLKIKPTVLQIRATSPAHISAPFRIENAGNDSLTLKIIFKRFRDSGDEQGKIVYSDPQVINQTDKDTFLQHIQIVADGSPTNSLTLGPKQQKELTLRINTDKSTPASDHYFSLVFLTTTTSKPVSSANEAKDSSFSNMQSGIALPVLISLNADNQAVGFLETFSAPIALQNGPVPFTIRVKNTGAHFIEARGIILIKNMFGQVVGRVDIPATNILADSTRALTNEKTIFTPRSPKGEVVWSEKFLLGFYTATLTLALSPEQSLYTRSIHFVAFPFVLLITIILIAIIAFILLRRIKKKVSEE